MAKFLRHITDKTLCIPDEKLEAAFELADREQSLVRVYADGNLIIDDEPKAGTGGCVTVDATRVLDAWRLYEIASESGVHGEFAGHDEADALETLHRAYGYAGTADAAERLGLTVDQVGALFTLRAL